MNLEDRGRLTSIENELMVAEGKRQLRSLGWTCVCRVLSRSVESNPSCPCGL